jgi:hypothetical protein
MTTVHAWFSAETALRNGSSVYRKPSGATVNVTRTDPDRNSKGSPRHDDIYVGEVVSSKEGGCVRALRRVRSITD